MLVFSSDWLIDWLIDWFRTQTGTRRRTLLAGREWFQQTTSRREKESSPEESSAWCREFMIFRIFSESDDGWWRRLQSLVITMSILLSVNTRAFLMAVLLHSCMKGVCSAQSAWPTFSWFCSNTMLFSNLVRFESSSFCVTDSVCMIWFQ